MSTSCGSPTASCEPSASPRTAPVRGPEVPHVGGIAPDGRLAIVAGEEVQLWDCATGRLGQRYLGSTIKNSRANALVQFSADGRMAVAGSKLHVWDLGTDRELLTLGRDELRIGGRDAGYFRFDGRTIVVSTRDGLREYDGTPEKP